MEDNEDGFVICPECDNEQPDMGHDAVCEECGSSPMPTHDDGDDE